MVRKEEKGKGLSMSNSKSRILLRVESRFAISRSLSPRYVVHIFFPLAFSSSHLFYSLRVTGPLLGLSDFGYVPRPDIGFFGSPDLDLRIFSHVFSGSTLHACEPIRATTCDGANPEWLRRSSQLKRKERTGYYRVSRNFA